jgi:hypothetical protein
MKSRSKSLLIILIIFNLGFKQAQAQLKGFSIGGYLEGGSPTAGFEDSYGNGIGAGLEADIKLPAKLGLTGSLGFMHFAGKRINSNTGTKKVQAINAMPIRVGLKYRFPLLYAKLEGGLARLGNDPKQAYILSPGLGIRVLGLDVQGKFEAWVKDDTWSFWGLKVGYHF